MTRPDTFTIDGGAVDVRVGGSLFGSGDLPRARPTPPPCGEGWRAERAGVGSAYASAAAGTSPTPIPSPQGGGEEYAAPAQQTIRLRAFGKRR